MENIFEVIQWVLVGIITPVAGWLVSGRLRETRTRKEVHDTYEKMYNSVSNSLIKLQNENERLFDAVQNLERAIAKAQVCRLYDNCPVVIELQKHENSHGVQCGRRARANRQCKREGRTPDEGADLTVVESDADAVV